MTAIAATETYLIVERVAELVQQHPSTVNRWCRLGRFPHAINPSRRWLIPEADVVAFLQSGRLSND
jgi:predicted site-specific integrase-resolvase